MRSSDAAWRNDAGAPHEPRWQAAAGDAVASVKERLPGTEHFFQRPEGDAVVRRVTDRLLPGETDDLRRLVPDPAALGHGERQRAVLPDKHLDEARAVVPFSKPLEL